MQISSSPTSTLTYKYPLLNAIANNHSVPTVSTLRKPFDCIALPNVTLYLNTGFNTGIPVLAFFNTEIPVLQKPYGIAIPIPSLPGYALP
jgi:hypothetical protein